MPWQSAKFSFGTWIADIWRFQQSRTNSGLVCAIQGCVNLDMLFDLLGYSGLVFADVFSNGLEGHAFIEAILNFYAVI
jgi:hypothetical protein